MTALHRRTVRSIQCSVLASVCVLILATSVAASAVSLRAASELTDQEKAQQQQVSLSSMSLTESMLGPRRVPKPTYLIPAEAFGVHPWQTLDPFDPKQKLRSVADYNDALARMQQKWAKPPTNAPWPFVPGTYLGFLEKNSVAARSRRQNLKHKLGAKSQTHFEPTKRGAFYQYPNLASKNIRFRSRRNRAKFDFGGLVNKVKAKAAAVTQRVQGAVQRISTRVSGVVSGLRDKVASVVQNVQGRIQGFTNRIQGHIGALTERIGGGINNIISGLREKLGGIGNVLNGFKDKLGGFLGKITNPMDMFTTSPIGVGAAGGGGGMFDGFLGKITGGLQGAFGKAQDFLGGLGAKASEFINGLGEKAQGFLGQFGGKLQEFAGNLGGQIQGMIGQVTGGLQNALTTLQDKFQNVVNQIGGSIQNAANMLGEKFNVLRDSVRNALAGGPEAIQNLLNKVTNGGLDGMVQKVQEGLNGGISRLTERARSVFTGVTAAVQQAVEQVKTSTGLSPPNPRTGIAEEDLTAVRNSGGPSLPEGVSPPIPTYTLGPAPGVSAYTNYDPYNPTLTPKDTETYLQQQRSEEQLSATGFQATPGLIPSAPTANAFAEVDSSVSSRTSTVRSSLKRKVKSNGDSVRRAVSSRQQRLRKRLAGSDRDSESDRR